MGCELLIEPRTHHALVLPFAAVLAGVWCLVAGDRRALPWTVLGASLLVQTHLSYVVPVVVLSLASAAAVVVLWRSSDAPERRAVHRTLLLSLVLLVVVWAQPLVDQLVGRQNLSAVLDAGQAEQASMGVVDGARAVATVVGPPAAWLRPAFLELDPAWGLVGAPAAGATLTVVAVAVAAIARRARRLGHGGLQAAAVTVGLALLAGWAGAARTPTGGAFGAVSGNFRFLWPVAVATWALGLAAAVAALPSARRRWASLGLATATTAVALASIPLSYQSPAPADDAPLRPTAQALLDGLDALEGRGPFLVDRSGLFFGEPYSYVLLLGLQERGVGFSLVATTDLSRFGDGRRPDGGEEGTLRLRTGAGAGEPPAGTELVLLVSPLTEPEARELSALDARRAAGGLRPGAEDRYEALRTRRDRGTLGLWLEPAGTSAGAGNQAAASTSTRSGP
jgi:hypothetical protein